MLGTYRFKTALVGGACAMALATAAAAENRTFDVPAGDLRAALDSYARQSGVQLLYRVDLVNGVSSKGAQGELSSDQALALVLADTGLQIRRHPSGAVAIVAAGEGGADPQSASAAGDGAEGTVEALIVTAQKREEDIQDVPIAISAFTQEQLERSQVAGGPDLMTQVPNMTFTKTNFTSYSIQIRGIGTQAISATTDPAVAVAFNNTPFVRNRFFEQEFYDLQRVEVLRGPQGTLYGRNATAGVVNIISQKPKFTYEAKLSGDVANYNSTRVEGMVNVPLVEDIVAFRLAGAWTKREGFVTNQITGNPIDGRDLWSTRASLRFAPSDRLDVNLIWEHFEEDDDRIRSGKQLCKTHEVTNIGSFQTTHFQATQDSGQSGPTIFSGPQANFSQGCIAESLYSPDSFQTPNGLSLPYYMPLGSIGLPIALTDPYVSRFQSTDLRVIESTVDPEYRAKSDLVELQAAFDLTDTLSLSSETAWASDFIFSTQDFNRFNTQSGAWDITSGSSSDELARGVLTPEGEFCDPQIGCADRLVAVDLSTARSRHFSQEFRLASDFEGPFNFSLGANYLRYDTEDKYYVFINSLSLISANVIFGVSDALRLQHPYDPGTSDNVFCLPRGLEPPRFDRVYGIAGCTYMDPNPIGSLNDLGHNYFLSRNPYKLISYAVFGEAYYNVTDSLKITAGLRWTVDKKEAPRIPSWLLAQDTVGYPVAEVIEQEWREPTGRLTVDWKPDLAFTDETLLYFSAAHGYKAGGANPPPPGLATYCADCGNADLLDAKLAESAVHPKTFDPEFINAFEIGAKNTLFDGMLTLNTAAFYYDYTGYQISQIVNRSAINDNFDAEVWGLEIEADWRPLENLKLGFKGGYENTRVADGMKAVDVMDRTAGMPGWVVVRPFPTFPANCIMPAWVFVGNTGGNPANPELVGVGSKSGGGNGGCELSYVLGLDPVTQDDYIANPSQFAVDTMHRDVINYTAWSTNPADYPGLVWPGGVVTDRTYPGWDPSTAPNNGEGFDKDLSGNELPNAPHFTATITADYTVPLPSDWLMTLHTDLYYQSEAWTRIFNTEGYDKLKAYTNVNLAAIFTNDEAGWKVMAYVKNVFDRDSITGAFLNSDDTGLTTNVFLTEPRLYGLRVTKEFRGGPWWTGADPSHRGPFPLTVELGGQIQRHDAPYETISASFEDEFSQSLQTFGDAQNRDLDWGDGREVKLIYRPGGGWNLSAGVRYGRTNSDTTRLHNLEYTAEVCGIPSFSPYQAVVCNPTSPYYDKYDSVQPTTRWSDAQAHQREEHQLIDFAVGKDIGIGGLARSILSAGLRFGQFQSDTTAYMGGAPDRYLKVGWSGAQFGLAKYESPFHLYRADFRAEREFEGVGPVLSWDAALALLGSEDTGRLQLDWSLSGGALFGEQRTTVNGTGEVEDRSLTSPDGPSRLVERNDLPPVAFDRSEDTTVPVAGASFGLSYDAGRINIGAGYRWERYFDVLDVGFQEEQAADRTIDGPYFKLSVGFGG